MRYNKLDVNTAELRFCSACPYLLHMVLWPRGHIWPYGHLIPYATNMYQLLNRRSKIKRKVFWAPWWIWGFPFGSSLIVAVLPNVVSLLERAILQSNFSPYFLSKIFRIFEISPSACDMCYYFFNTYDARVAPAVSLSSSFFIHSFDIFFTSGYSLTLASACML